MATSVIHAYYFVALNLKDSETFKGTVYHIPYGTSWNTNKKLRYREEHSASAVLSCVLCDISREKIC